MTWPPLRGSPSLGEGWGLEVRWERWVVVEPQYGGLDMAPEDHCREPERGLLPWRELMRWRDFL